MQSYHIFSFFQKHKYPLKFLDKQARIFVYAIVLKKRCTISSTIRAYLIPLIVIEIKQTGFIIRRINLDSRSSSIAERKGGMVLYRLTRTQIYTNIHIATNTTARAHQRVQGFKGHGPLVPMNSMKYLHLDLFRVHIQHTVHFIHTMHQK